MATGGGKEPNFRIAHGAPPKAQQMPGDLPISPLAQRSFATPPLKIRDARTLMVSQCDLRPPSAPVESLSKFAAGLLAL